MDKKQDIGAAFKQRLEGLNQGPSDSAALWEQIASQLEAEGTQPKGMPFWLKSGLAVLIVGITTFGIWKFTNSSDTALPENSEVTQNNTETGDTSVTTTSPNNKNNKQSIPVAAQDAETVAETTDTAAEDNTLESAAQQNSIINKEKTAVTATTTVNKNNSEENKTATQTKITDNTKLQSAVASGVQNRSNDNTTVATLKTSGSKENSVNTNVATLSSEQNAVNATDRKASAATGLSTQSGTKTTTAATNTGVKAQSEQTAKGTYPARGYYAWPKNTTKPIDVDASVYATQNEIKTGEQATELPIVQLEEPKKKIKKSKEFRAFERAINLEEMTNWRWSVGAVVAPTTYGSLTKGSMLDARLENNPREGETNLSYGLQIKNQMNRNSALRFGINRVNLGYNTQNFQVNIIDNVVNIYQLTGIDPGTEIQQGGIPLNPNATEFFNSNDVVTIDQDISYLEIPVEYQYSFINNRFGANFIGGASLIVLDDNRIFAVNDLGQSVAVGKSSNLTNLGYTLNFGLGLKYDISKHFQLNLDPMLKIQMNSPENTSVNNFRPYFFGIFSGLHFKF
ncbi:outer membrane beta-barrel protein [Gilvibacter sp.]|uniref:outer membrane beta-barrel protein n=1 Tax=Gilvibacter sp. TaxID=2729997 RepID=UPI003B516F33